MANSLVDTFQRSRSYEVLRKVLLFELRPLYLTRSTWQGRLTCHDANPYIVLKKATVDTQDAPTGDCEASPEETA